MSDADWDAKLKAFLKKTGDDFKRFGRDVKEEAKKLLSEVKDPHRQQKLRESLKEVGRWARKTAEEVATVMETGVKKAEDAFRTASGRVADFVRQDTSVAPEPARTPPSPPPDMEPAPPPDKVPPPRPRAARKSLGPRPGKSGGKKGGSTRKTIGRKTSGSPE